MSECTHREIVPDENGKHWYCGECNAEFSPVRRISDEGLRLIFAIFTAGPLLSFDSDEGEQSNG
jgi:hypothetical protein